MTSYQLSSQLAFQLSKILNTDFKDGRHGGHLGLPIRTILAIFDVQVTPMLPIKFQVNWPLVSGAKAKKIFKMVAMVTILDFWSEQF